MAAQEGGEVVPAAMGQVDGDPLAGIAVTELARRCGVDRSSLARQFRRVQGCSPSTYVARVRLAHAAALLAGGMKVAEVAARCGYSDAFSFSTSKAFRRMFGVPPSRWRGCTGCLAD